MALFWVLKPLLCKYPEGLDPKGCFFITPLNAIGFLVLNALSLSIRFFTLWALSVESFIPLARDLMLNVLLLMAGYSWVFRTLSLDLKVTCITLIYIIITG